MRVFARLRPWSLAAFLLLVVSGGCGLLDKSRMPQDDADRVPWNTRSDWEGKGSLLP